MDREQNGSCLASMLDVRNYIMAARQSVNSTHPGAVVFIIFIFGLIGLCLAPTWVGHDLFSTFSWAAGTASSTDPAVAAVAQRVSGAVAPASAVVGDMTLDQALGALIVVGITLLPTLFELGFPMVKHPLLMLVLNASILFDYITDFGLSWDSSAGWSGADNWLIHFCWAAIYNLWVSVLVQAVLVICATVVVFGVIRLVRGAAPSLTRGTVVLSER